ncbi:MAG: SusC/RagA family TonB-linked outer membrane protein [Bacteroidota bacterium]
MRKFSFLITILLLAGIQVLYAQKKVITGKVTTSEDGSTIPGVTVLVKGTTIGTTTNLNGEYSITVPEKSNTLVFSFVGMKAKEVKIDKTFTINVVLDKDVMNIEGAVVTAIGIKRETKALGYSVQNVNGDLIEKSQNANVVNSLDGKVAGVQVTNSSGAAGSSSQITIRGNSSILGDNQPLFVVDGVPIDNSQTYSGNPDNGTNNLTQGVAYSNRAIDLNPDDIESVSVLKGGAATALYGLRAANGVVLITTKKGSTAQTGGSKFSVDFNSSVSFDVVSQLPKMQNKYGQGVNGHWSGPETYNRNSWGPKLDTCAWDGSDYLYDKNGRIVSMNSPLATKKVTPYDNLGTFFKTGVSYNNALSVSGGNNDAAYYLSLSNLTSEGIVPNNTFNKTTIKVSGEAKLSQKFTTSGSVNYIKSGGDRLQQGSNLSGVMLGLLRTTPSFDNSNGFSDPVNTPAAYLFPDGTERSYRPGIYDNPYWSVNQDKFTDDVNHIIGSIQASYLPLDWLNITYRIGTDWYSDRRKGYFAINSGANPLGQTMEDQHYNRDINSDLIVTIKKDISKDFKADLTIGQNMYQTYHQQLYVEGDQLNVSNYYNINNASSILARENQAEKRTAAFYGDLGLSYQSMAFLNITGRNEWSTTLPADANSFFFPSASAGFVFTELPFLKDNKILPFGKLRVSYAVIGSDASIYATHSTYAGGFFQDGWTTGISSPYFGLVGYTKDNGLGSSNLKPEKLKSFEIGVDLRFLNNKVGLDFTYYDNKNEDLLIWAPMAGSSGYTDQYINAASMENKGIEITLNATPIKNKDWTWDININFTKNNNMVTKLADGVDNVGLGGFTGAEIRAVVGKPYGSIYGTQWIKDANGNVVIFENASTPGFGSPKMSDQEAYLGTVQPDWTSGIGSSLKYKNITLSFLFDIKAGGKMWNGTKGIMYALGTHADTEDRGTSEVISGVQGHYDGNGNLVIDGTNTLTTVKNQAWYTGVGGGFNGPTEQFIEDANWVRLREVSLYYSLSKKILGKSIFKGVDVFVTGKNLWLSTPYTGVDPETSLYGASNAQGLDYFNMPGTRTYIVGLKVKL